MNEEIALFHDLAARLAAAATSQPVTDLVLAAYQGDDALDDVLGGGTPSRPGSGDETTPEETTNVFLESIKVTGFRGVGPAARLGLQPKAGLTLVIGRNGSGKSSFAEAAELALTDDSMRWAQRPVVFREGWRNLHHDGDAEITVKLRVDGSPKPVTIQRQWDSRAVDPADAVVTAYVGTARQKELPAWLGHVGLYRPFLSARDLERVITAKPSELYDALAPILGLDPLSAAEGRLQRRRKERDDRAKALKSQFSELCRNLAAVDDERARHALAALGARPAKADMATLTALAEGEAEDADVREMAAARQLIVSELPDVEGALTTLAEAQVSVEGLAGTSTATAERTADLLRRALDQHAAEGDQPCPVCRVGRLDASWRLEAEAEIGQLSAVGAQARAVHERLAISRRAADQMLASVRSELSSAANALSEVLPEPAKRLSDAVAALPPTVDSVDVIRAAFRRVATEYAVLAEEATRWVVHRQNVWREPAAALRRWLDAAAIVTAEASELRLITNARTTLTAMTSEIRAARLAAFVGQSEHIWQRLRQESNVELHEMRMEGTSTQRRVRFPVAVDGAEANALAVMSQGELHALGLAVFLPRACAEASPYRFVIIDDPVQSMDPAKVDGLAEVLGEIALTRQVVVFTHDDRLPQAIRSLGLEATVWEVGRREGSVVEPRKAAIPADRYLDDARALSAADSLPEDARYPVVAGFCRSALEAVSMDHYRERHRREGTTYDEIEKALAGAVKVMQLLTLALLDDPGRGGELYAHMNRRYGSWATNTVKAVAEGTHGTRRMAMDAMVAYTSDLVDQLR
ncbi:AAA family ATPase [Actinoplanes sp. TBRC 11911]|uniref:AAA family ATPase n=1 Tax=Actinoplanes sp. TBRC 11911 TaxID=2729386 RepID=UPI00145CBEA7|nr:AAA family ATPase [Actinoplanes sp. TBRC 11911]NMO57596.1 AAA family ATPase [Actinoplanes sp. TBRC 11911]